MRRDIRTLLFSAALLALIYAAGLGVWPWLAPYYLQALALGVDLLRTVGVSPQALQPVVVPAQGLALVGDGMKGVAVPWRILGADLSLGAALILSTPWLRWRSRAGWAYCGVGVVFVAHLATITAEAWTTVGPSTGLRSIWALWTALYQGKVVPIGVWALLVGLPHLGRTVRAERGGVHGSR